MLMAGGDRCGKSILERTTPIRKSKAETDGSESKPAISGSKSAYIVLPVVVVVVVAAVVVMISMCGLHYPPTIISYIGDPKQDHSFVDVELSRGRV